MAQLNAAKALIISPARKELLPYYERKYGKPGNSAYIIEDEADTTLMNAINTARLINDHRLESILLVTSDYHMARSFLLLKLATSGTDCRIGIHKVDTFYSSPKDWRGRVNGLKMAYNEMVQLWGSFVEWGLYIKGGASERKVTRTSGWARWLRERLLFDVRYE